MAEEAPPLERTALSLGLVVPSPVPMTESDEEAPQSAQVPDDGNSDNAEGAAIPTVQAELAQTLLVMILRQPPVTDIDYIQRIFRIRITMIAKMKRQMKQRD